MNALRKYKTPIKVMVSIAILVALLLQLDMQSLSTHIKDVSFNSWLIAIPLVIGQLIFISLRWRNIVNLNDTAKISRIEAIRICTLGAIANLLFINSIGGILVRVALGVQHGLNLSISVTAGLVDRLFTVFALIALSASLYPYLKQHIPPHIYDVSGITLIGFIAAGLLAVSILMAKPWPLKNDNVTALRQAMHFMQKIIRHKTALAKLSLYSILAQSLYIISCYFIIIASGVEIPFTAIVALLPLIALISSIPLGYGGWGVREGAFVVGLGFLGVSMETAFLISIQIGMIGILSTLMAAIPFLVLQKGDMFKIDDLKKLQSR